MPSTKPPKQLRLTFKQEREYVELPVTEDNPNGDWGYRDCPYPLGFAQVYEPTKKGWEKKQLTQDNWAYEINYMGGCVYDESGRVWSVKDVWDREKHIRVGTERVMVPNHLQPKIIDNVPLDGFRIQHSVSRYSTSNKLWRVLDPRGFELEINTGNFETLVMNAVIDHGLIKATCIWEGKSLVIV